MSEKRRKILVLDDSELVLHLVGMTLGKAGYEVVTISDLDELTTACDRERPDLALVDLGLPRYSPDEVAGVVKRDVRCPCVLITDHDGDELARLVAISGARAALRKTHDPRELVRALVPFPKNAN